MKKKVINWLCAFTVGSIILYAAWQFLFMTIYGLLTGQFL